MSQALTTIALRRPSGEILQFVYPPAAEASVRPLLEAGYRLPALPQGYRFATVVDVGAGLGAGAMALSLRLRPQRLVCFEPAGVAFDLLARNMAALPGAEVLPWSEGDAGHAFAALGLQAISLLRVAGAAAAVLRALGERLDRIDLLVLHYHNEAERRALDVLTAGRFLLAGAQGVQPHQGVAIYLHQRLAAAVPAYALAGRRADQSPDDAVAEAWCAATALRLEADDPDEAERCLAEAFRHGPNCPAARHGLARLALRRGDGRRATNALLAAVRQGLSGDAISADFDRALVLMEAGGAAAIIAAAHALTTLGEVEVAERWLAAAGRLDPQAVEPAWMIGRLAPKGYASTAAEQATRQRFLAALDALATLPPPATPEETLRQVKGLGCLTNFPLGYFAANDRAALERFGRMACRVMQGWLPHLATPLPRLPHGRDRRLRVGYISSNFRAHTIGLLFNGWLRHADHDRFITHVYFPCGTADSVTRTFAEQADVFRDLSRHGMKEVAEIIAADRLDVLVYPDLGMDAWTGCLAALRLAPVQCLSWGHPITSGLPSMDYFLSAELMEPPGAEAHYSEKLVRLPRLGIAYHRPQTTPSDRPLGLPEGMRYLCSQAFQKYRPEHDDLLPAIAAAVPDARFVFVAHDRHHGAAEVLKDRLGAAFRQHGLDPQHYLFFVPRLPWEEFLALNAQCHVFLDTPDWSGGNTALEALSLDLPVVTLPGAFMRGRHASAFLRLLEAEQGIATDKADYVAKAVRLGTDPVFRHAAVAAIRANRSRLYEDVGAVRALEDFYVEACRSAAPSLSEL